MRATLACAVLFAGLAAVAVAAPVPKADPLPAVTKEHLATSAANLKEIGIDFHSYHDANGVLPGDIISKDGKPLLSWRVAILPFLEQDNLYRQFKLDEPWDSDNNKKLIEKMPKTYAPIRVKAPAGTTYYQSFYGPKTLFDPNAKKRPTLQFVSENNGTASTILVIEAGVPTVWTKPLDLPFDAKKALPARGGMFDGDFHILFCDGSVRFLGKATAEKPLKCAIDPENTEVAGLPKP